jgi:NADH:ubiquinone oxidoreductase subunit H
MESEIVAGHLTETSATIFIFLYLAEYNAILFYSCFMSILFFGGTQIPFLNFVSEIISISHINMSFGLDSIIFYIYPYFSSLISGISLGIKTVILSYIIYILTRGTLPRVLFSKLIEFS